MSGEVVDKKLVRRINKPPHGRTVAYNQTIMHASHEFFALRTQVRVLLKSTALI